MSQSESSRPHYAPGVPAEIPPVTRTIDQFLFDAAQEFPERIAIDFLGRTFTYRELRHAVRKAQAALYRTGVRNGDVVALIMPNCPQHVVAFYAVLSLGATVAEHNPLAPAAELHEQLESHGATVVIAWEQTLEQLTADGDFRGHTYLSVDLSVALPFTSRVLLRLPIKAAREQKARLRGTVPSQILSFDRIVEKAPLLPRETVLEPPRLDEVAVLIHTGGTTGVPKAVQLTHANVVANVSQTTLWVNGIRAGHETFAGVLPFFHAFGLQTILGVGLSQAATLIILPNFDVPAFLAAQKRRPMTLFPGVAPMYARVLKAAEADPSADLSSIRWSFSGAMALSPELASEWEATTGGLIIEGYGMSEASPIIAGSPVSNERRPSTLGVPFPSTEVRIADPEDLSKDAEGIGEILVRGPQVFKGYFGEPEETAQAFHDGWLRTGDLATWEDGFIVMADRAKEMIIQGGFNVYPTQVEDVLRAMPGVRDVAVVGMPDDSRGESVVAALVLEPDTTVDLDMVRRWAYDKLSHYAIPKSIAVVDDLPRSQLGKVMRRSIREQLEGFELTAGQWRAKATAASGTAGVAMENLATTLSQQYNTTREQLQEWLGSLGESLEGIQEKLAESREHQDLTDELRGRGISKEAFSAWLSKLNPTAKTESATDAKDSPGDPSQERSFDQGTEDPER